jgi:hypothetical protein
MTPARLLAALGLLIHSIQAVNFPFEEIQLTVSDIANNSALSFGNATSITGNSGPPCKAVPGTEHWPSEAQWSGLNDTLEGLLLKPDPLASACYSGQSYDAARCRYLLSPMSGLRRAYLDDPLTVLTQWPQGETCLASLKPQGNCSLGGYPVYVAKVSTVKHIQAAVNFARNMNVRLVIK